MYFRESTVRRNTTNVVPPVEDELFLRTTAQFRFLSSAANSILTNAQLRHNTDDGHAARWEQYKITVTPFRLYKRRNMRSMLSVVFTEKQYFLVDRKGNPICSKRSAERCCQSE